MRKSKKRKGSVYLIVVMIFLFVSLFSALMLQTLSQSIFQTHMYGMNMKCYYLSRQTADAVVAALLQHNNELLNDLHTTMNDSMEHLNEAGEPVGNSHIVLRKERHTYYDENKEWVVAYITTTIPDERGSRQGETYTYEMTLMILVENPLIQLYDIDPDSL